MFVGEMGINRKEYLYELSFCDLLLYSRGYERRNRHMWSAIRWQTHQLMISFVGSDKMEGAGIHSPKDLLKFPWEREKVNPLSEQDIKDLQADIDFANALLQAQRGETVNP